MANAAPKASGKPAATKTPTDEPTERERAVVAREAELEEREAKVKQREEQVEENAAQQAAITEELDARRDELDEREQAADDAATAGAEVELSTTAAEAFSLLPEPAEGFGFIVTEAPLPLVTVMANLHPSDRKSVGEQVAGAMTNVLIESNRMRSNRAIAELEPAEFAVLSEHAVESVDRDPEPGE